MNSKLAEIHRQHKERRAREAEKAAILAASKHQAGAAPPDIGPLNGPFRMEFTIRRETPLTRLPPHIQLITIVGEAFDVSVGEIIGSDRIAHIMIARQVAMYVMRQCMPTASTPVIGHHFGGRDHATVLNNLKRVAERMAEDPDLAEKVNACIARYEDLRARSGYGKEKAAA